MRIGDGDARLAALVDAAGQGAQQEWAAGDGLGMLAGIWNRRMHRLHHSSVSAVIRTMVRKRSRPWASSHLDPTGSWPRRRDCFRSSARPGRDPTAVLQEALNYSAIPARGRRPRQFQSLGRLKLKEVGNRVFDFRAGCWLVRPINQRRLRGRAVRVGASEGDGSSSAAHPNQGDKNPLAPAGCPPRR